MSIFSAAIMGFLYQFGNVAGLYLAFLLHEIGVM